MKEPSRDLPKVIYFAMPTVVCCYIVTNLAYYVVIPWTEVSASNAIAVVRSIFSLAAATFIELRLTSRFNTDCGTEDVGTISRPRLCNPGFRLRTGGFKH